MSTLVDLKTHFLLGKYQSVTELASRLKPSSPSERVERDVYMYRAFIEQGNYQIVVDEVLPEKSEPPLKATCALAQLHAGNVEKEQISRWLETWSEDATCRRDVMFLLMASFVYFKLGDVRRALQCVRYNPLLEARLFVIHILLHLRRHDLALKELGELRKDHESALPVRLVTAWVGLALGQADQLDEAIDIYEQILKEHADAFVAFYGIGMCKLRKQQYAQSEKYLLLALEKNPNSIEAIVNLVILSQHLGRVEENQRYLSQLKKVDPCCSFLALRDELTVQFDAANTLFESSSLPGA